MGVQHITDSPIKALDHAIGLWRSGFCQAVLNAQGFAQLIELMVAARLTLTIGKQAVSELFAVVSEQLDDFDGARLVQCVQKCFRTGRCPCRP